MDTRIFLNVDSFKLNLGKRTVAYPCLNTQSIFEGTPGLLRHRRQKHNETWGRELDPSKGLTYHVAADLLHEKLLVGISAPKRNI